MDGVTHKAARCQEYRDTPSLLLIHSSMSHPKREDSLNHCGISVMLGLWSILYALKPTGSTSLDGVLLSSHVFMITSIQASRYSYRCLKFAASSAVFLLRDWALINKQVGRGSQLFMLFSVCLIPPLPSFTFILCVRMGMLMTRYKVEIQGLEVTL